MAFDDSRNKIKKNEGEAFAVTHDIETPLTAVFANTNDNVNYFELLLISKSSHYILLHNAFVSPSFADSSCSVLWDFIAGGIQLRG